MEPVPGAVEDKGDDGNSSSYTSVYTWTTATGTITNTAQMGVPACCLALTDSLAAISVTRNAGTFNS